MSVRHAWLRTFLAALTALILAACAGDSDGTDGAPDASDATAPPSTTTPAAEESIIERLRANADAFGYDIGTPGGTVTTATISKPLTFNLALANDAYSRGSSATCSRG